MDQRNSTNELVGPNAARVNPTILRCGSRRGFTRVKWDTGLGEMTLAVSMKTVPIVSVGANGRRKRSRHYGMLRMW
jgi:hypothetical protein